VERKLEALVKKAKRGEREALEALVTGIQDRIYGMAIRMLYYPADAEDATQEILIRIITHLDGFREESRFVTWASRIATNHLLTTRRRKAETWNLTFEKCEQAIEEGLAYSGHQSFHNGESDLLVKEMQLVCTQALLLCLNRDLRMAFVLGEIFKMSSQEAGEILDITPEAFRQRLSRGRRQLCEFLRKKCSLINPENPCHCEEILPCDIEKRELIDPENLLFATHPCHAQRNPAAANLLEEIGELERVVALFRSHPDYAAPASFAGMVKEMVNSSQFEYLRH
jgi:RNA polymerase sigma factor (sigma-70 family)